jgi:hypothetical protein
MDRPHSDPPASPGSGFSLLRPAVPPRSAEAHVGRPSGGERSLGPFSPPRRQAEAADATPPSDEPQAATEPQTAEPQAIEELPWALLDAPLWDDSPESPASEVAAPAAGDADPGSPSYDVEELTLEDESEWLDFESSADTPIAEDALEPLAEASEPGQGPLVGEELLAPPEWEYGFEDALLTDVPALTADAPASGTEPAGAATEAASSADTALPELSPASGAARSAAVEEVAAQLERIAQSLRGRTPADLLSGATDPLHLLIAGYALGLEAARAERERE